MAHPNPLKHADNAQRLKNAFKRLPGSGAFIGDTDVTTITGLCGLIYQIADSIEDTLADRAEQVERLQRALDEANAKPNRDRTPLAPLRPYQVEAAEAVTRRVAPHHIHRCYYNVDESPNATGQDSHEWRHDLTDCTALRTAYCGNPAHPDRIPS